jgi:amino-acid N-acetyltransferase
MHVRKATVRNARAISDLVNHWAEQGLMLHRSLESTYESLRDFSVAESDGCIVGCVALDVYWGDLAEIRSLAVAPDAKGTGVGRALVQAALDDAEALGISRVFAMTYEKPFFTRLGFEEIDLKALPEKIWRECLEWYSQGHRHETAMLRHLTGPEADE